MQAQTAGYSRDPHQQADFHTPSLRTQSRRSKQRCRARVRGRRSWSVYHRQALKHFECHSHNTQRSEQFFKLLRFPPAPLQYTLLSYIHNRVTGEHSISTRSSFLTRANEVRRRNPNDRLETVPRSDPSRQFFSSSLTTLVPVSRLTRKWETNEQVWFHVQIPRASLTGFWRTHSTLASP